MDSALRSAELLDRPQLLQVQCRCQLQQLYRLLSPLRLPHCSLLCAHSNTGSGEPMWLEWASRCRRTTTSAKISQPSVVCTSTAPRTRSLQVSAAIMPRPTITTIPRVGQQRALRPVYTHKPMSHCRYRCAQVFLNVAWTHAPQRGYAATPR